MTRPYLDPDQYLDFVSINDLVPLEQDYEDCCDLPHVGVWDGHKECVCCGCDLEEIGRMDNAIVLQCPSCRLEHRGFDGHIVPRKRRRWTR